MRSIPFFILASLFGSALLAQDSADRVTVPFSDPSRPHRLKVGLVSGAITVKGYNGKDAIVEGRGGDSRERERDRDRDRSGRGAEGMHRIDNTSSGGLTVEEEDNQITVSTRSPNRFTELVIQVPVNTSLKLSVVNGGNITVDNVSGEIEVNNVNGGVKLTNVSGSVIAHALNHNVVVTLTKATPDKSMSFSSLNGDIDVTLPADIKAKAKLKTDNGEIYSDFDVKIDPASRQPVVEEGRSGGKYRVRIDKTMYGLINGGGPEILFQTFNGNIYIRKAK
jgi:DUF4097 and DUF4098 domain-containing protein YvlB